MRCIAVLEGLHGVRGKRLQVYSCPPVDSSWGKGFAGLSALQEHCQPHWQKGIVNDTRQARLEDRGVSKRSIQAPLTPSLTAIPYSEQKSFLT